LQGRKLRIRVIDATKFLRNKTTGPAGKEYRHYSSPYKVAINRTTIYHPTRERATPEKFVLFRVTKDENIVSKNNNQRI